MPPKKIGPSRNIVVSDAVWNAAKVKVQQEHGGSIAEVVRDLLEGWVNGEISVEIPLELEAVLLDFAEDKGLTIEDALVHTAQLGAGMLP